MLDVLIDLRLAAYRGGGIARYARELHAGLTGVQGVHAVALRSQRDHVTDANALRIRTPPHHRFEAWAVPTEVAISRRRFDVIHATDFIAPYFPGTPTVATVHDLALHDWPEDLAPDALRYYLHLERSKERTAAWIVPSEWTAHALARHHGISPASIHVIPHGVSLDLLAAPVVPRVDRGDYILAVGTVEPRKQFDLLLDALELDHELPRLVIAGSPGWNAAATEHRLRCSPRVIWEQNISDVRLRDLYRHALVLAFPSRAEGFGLPALEAMATGTPVVSSGGGALPEVTGSTAITVGDPDPEAWATALRRVVDDASGWEQMANIGRQRAATFSWSAAARQTANIYRAVSYR